MRKMVPLGGVRGGNRKEEEPGRAEVAPAASLDSKRRSEKAKVLEDAYLEVQRLRDPRTSDEDASASEEWKPEVRFGYDPRRRGCVWSEDEADSVEH